MKKLLRFLLFLAFLVAVAAVAARVRERLAAPVLLGSPAGLEPEPEPAGAPAEDLAEVKGIGPVFRSRLAASGITTFAELAAADPAAVTAATGVPEERAADWIAQAAGLAAR